MFAARPGAHGTAGRPAARRRTHA
uniref:Uncharacterized protein n=1 Tax=Arundo donax TaxID=35708 RepID=A0A0A8YDW9_ARUDO